MTGLALKLTEEQVAALACAPFGHVGTSDIISLISDWRTLRAALDEQVKENERLRKLESIVTNNFIRGWKEQAEAAEAALASANEITEEKVERALKAVCADDMPASYMIAARPKMHAALLAAQGKQPEGVFDKTKPFRCRNGQEARVNKEGERDLFGEKKDRDGWKWYCWGKDGYSHYSADFDLVNDPAPQSHDQACGADDLKAPYVPCVVHFNESGVSEFVQEDVAIIWKWLGDGIQAGYAMDDGRLVGVQWPLASRPDTANEKGDKK